MMRMRHVKLLAAVTVVLLTLSGFSQARGSGGRGGGSKSHSSGGGGCSSEKSSSHSGSSDSYDSARSGSNNSGHDGYRSGARYDSTNGGSGSNSSGGASSHGTRSASGSLVACAASSQDRPSATVRVRNSGSRSGTYTVKVNFRDRDGGLLDTGSAVATLRADSTRRVQVRMDDPTLVSKVSDCELESVR